MSQDHLAIFSKDVILDLFRATKSVDIRLSKLRQAPYRQVDAGDRVLVKISGGVLVGEFMVGRLIFFENLNREMIAKIKSDYGREIFMHDDFWKQHMDARYATLIYIQSPKRYLKPVVVKKSDLRSWVVLTLPLRQKFFGMQ